MAFLVLPRLLLSLLLSVEFELVGLQFLLKSLQFNLILQDDLLVVLYLLLHALNLLLLLLQRFLVGGYHFLFLDRGLPLEHLLQAFQLFFLELQFLFLLLDLLSLGNQSLLDRLNFSHQVVSG